MSNAEELVVEEVFVSFETVAGLMLVSEATVNVDDTVKAVVSVSLTVLLALSEEMIDLISSDDVEAGTAVLENVPIVLEFRKSGTNPGATPPTSLIVRSRPAASTDPKAPAAKAAINNEAFIFRK